MNARQAAKQAAKHIEELEHYNHLCTRDIKAYNRIVLGLIAGDLNPCDWCNDQEDCAPIDQGKGCKDWFLKFDLDGKLEEVKPDDDKSEAVPVTGSTGRTGDPDDQGAAPSL